MANKTGLKESAVLSQCLAYLCGRGFYVWRNNSGAYKDASGRFIRFGKKGSSDIIGILHDGRFLAVECKRENGGILSNAQAEFIARIRAEGGVAVVANSLEALKDELRNNGVRL